mmetsp:Transcript_22226/g.46352  ORF Transcript_22226/g.46352 Transcript_22226/m.46352 type:complete len:83 (+) Transcript_22226:74-322(+)
MRILQRLVSLLVFILGVLSKSVRGDENDEHVLSNGENIVQFVVHNIEDYDVTVFAKSYCPVRSSCPCPWSFSNNESIPNQPI